MLYTREGKILFHPLKSNSFSGHMKDFDTEEGKVYITCKGGDRLRLGWKEPGLHAEELRPR